MDHACKFTGLKEEMRLYFDSISKIDQDAEDELIKVAIKKWQTTNSDLLWILIHIMTQKCTIWVLFFEFGRKFSTGLWERLSELEAQYNSPSFSFFYIMSLFSYLCDIVVVSVKFWPTQYFFLIRFSIQEPQFQLYSWLRESVLSSTSIWINP